MNDYPKVTLGDMQALYWLDNRELEDGSIITKTQDSIKTYSRSWYLVSGIIFEWKGRYFLSYYYHDLESERRSIGDIEDLHTEMDLTEVEPKEVPFIIYVKKETN